MMFSAWGPTMTFYRLLPAIGSAVLEDKAEIDCLNAQPTSLVLPPEAVDRLRATAATIVIDSPEFKRLLKDVGAMIAPGIQPAPMQPGVKQ
jgi:NTE family protein